MKPQLSDRVLGKDGKVYLVSTMRYQKRQFEEVWETAVFEGGGCLTFGRLQRHTWWSFDPDHAQLEHGLTVNRVRNDHPNTWLMKPEAIKADRKAAIEHWEKPVNPLATPREEEEDDDDYGPNPPSRQYGELEVDAFEGPGGRFEPGDRLRLHVAPSGDDADSPLRGDLTGRFLGIQSVNGKKHLVLEIVGTDQGSYRTTIPVEHAGGLTRVEGGDQAEPQP